MQALLNGYLREIGPDLPVPAADKEVEIPLTHLSASLRIVIAYRSSTGPHRFGAARLLPTGAAQPREVSAAQVISMIAQECFARTNLHDSDKLPEFIRGVFNSNAEIEKILHHSLNRPEPASFLQAEQALAYGHWLHPTPKSRDGLTDWQQTTFAPEYEGRFALTFFAADKSIVSQSSAVGSMDDIFGSIPEVSGKFQLSANETLIPAHPIQAQALRLDRDVRALLASGKLRELGEAGAQFSATSSLRTVFSEDCPWMFKFSVPVRLTNSLRITLRNELDVGVAMARLLDHSGFRLRDPRFQIIHDPAFITVNLPNRSESGFEVIVRQNPFVGLKGDGVYNLAALTADPLPGRSSLLASIITRLAQTRRASEHEITLLWFRTYLECMLDPILSLYDQHGIALEAHQQNSLLDLRTGLPSRAYYRDNQGYFITKDAFPRLSAAEPSLAGLPALVYDRKHINQRLAYYLIVNQIFAVIRRLGCDGLAPEAQLLGYLRTHLISARSRLTGAGLGFVTELLTAPQLATKANLLTRAHDMDELTTQAQEGLFLNIPNPIATAQAASSQELTDVFA